MHKITVTLPDGKSLQLEAGSSLRAVAEQIGPRLAKAALAGKVDGKLVDLAYPLERDVTLALLTFDDPEGRQVYWHSSAHVLAQAVQELFPETKLAIGPPIEDGFYYDMDPLHPFTEEDLARIEQRMSEIIQADYPIHREIWSRAKALQWFKEKGEIYKVSLLEEEIQEPEVSLYRQDNWIDLCRGPHLPSTGKIGVVKLLSLAGAYWHGDEDQPMLQRLYGISYPNKKQLAVHLQRLEEARRRDHRTLGSQLDLFSIHQDVGAGLVIWHPKGGMIRTVVEDFCRDAHLKNGYDLVYSPHLGKSQLWETSGHLDFYRENMYAPMEVEGQTYYLRPMNCPFHIMIYKNQRRSYRDLPQRFAEFGTVYRFERSGVLHGLLRVRGFTQDDAHIFCRPDQVEAEIRRVLDFTLYILGSFGFSDFDFFLSTRPAKYVGDPAHWEQATDALRTALESRGFDYQVDEGGGAFYGPKIDIQIKDVLGRSWQCTTVQFDFNLPERFDLNYIGEDGKAHRPYMVHRALLGSMERFFGILIEHYAGDFPTWLAPIQAIVLPIADRHKDYAEAVCRQLQEEQIRAQVEGRDSTIGAKIREAEMQKIPYMLIVGDREVERGTVSVRKRHAGDLGQLSTQAFLKQIREEIARHATARILD